MLFFYFGCSLVFRDSQLLCFSAWELKAMPNTCVTDPRWGKEGKIHYTCENLFLKATFNRMGDEGRRKTNPAVNL